MSASTAYFVFLRRSAKNMAAKFKGRAKKVIYIVIAFIFIHRFSYIS